MYEILNYEYYPYSNSKTDGDRFGWCNNFKGFISYRRILNI